MAEILFIATTIFVAYVVFEVVGKKTDKTETKKPSAKPATTPEPKAAKTETQSPPAKPVNKTTSAKPQKAPAEKAAASSSAHSLKNPKTGEVAKMPSNYAFAKRWIKEALVEEGLLDKIYKNNEIDAAVTAKIHDALQQLQALEKYQ